MGDYFFVSSVVVLAFTELPVLQQFLAVLTEQSSFVFCAGILLLPALAVGSVLAVHWAGHLAAAWLAGFEVTGIKIGRLVLRDRLDSTDVLSLGSIIARPRCAERLNLRLAGITMGGPLANLAVPLVLEGVLRLGQSYGMAMYFLVPAGIHLFAALSFLAGIAALLPEIDSSGNFSDGTRLLMLLRNDPRGQRLLAMLELQLRLRSSPLQAEWGNDLLGPIVAQQDESFDTVAANWLAYLWASAHQDVGQAAKFLETALAVSGASPGHLRDRLYLEAAVFHAWFRHNHVKAKFWESQITRFDSLTAAERKRLEIACCWAEGKLFDAWERVGAYLRWLSELPPSHVRSSAEHDAREWKTQMESRMLSGAWATMHSWPYARRVQ